MERAKALRTDGSLYDSHDFVSRVSKKLGFSDREGIDWSSSSALTIEHFRRPPSVGFMLGPLSIVAKVIQQRKPANRQESSKVLRKPEQVCCCHLVF